MRGIAEYIKIREQFAWCGAHILSVGWWIWLMSQRSSCVALNEMYVGAMRGNMYNSVWFLSVMLYEGSAISVECWRLQCVSRFGDKSIFHKPFVLVVVGPMTIVDAVNLWLLNWELVSRTFGWKMRIWPGLEPYSKRAGEVYLKSDCGTISLSVNYGVVYLVWGSIK